MVHLDSDLLGILLALLTFIVPVITSIKESKKKKARQQQEIELDEQDGPVADTSDGLEEMFNILLGKQTEEILSEEDEEVAGCADFSEVMEPQRPAAAELEKKEAFQSSVEPVSEMENEVEDKAGPTIKEKLRNNPADAVILGEILKPKFKEY